MAESPAVSLSPRTLHEAKQVIARLRQQIGQGPPKPPAGKPMPKDYPPTNPALPANPPKGPTPTGGEPIPKTPEDPYPILPGREPPINPSNRMDLAALPPKKLAEFLDCCSVVVLKKLLSLETGKLGKEQDAGVVLKLYKELKKRGA